MAAHGPADRPANCAGFTLVELMLVVLIIGVLVTIAMPVLAHAAANSEKKTCFANQRSIESALGMWRVDPANTTSNAVVGLVDGSNVLISHYFVLRPPRCPSAPKPVDFTNPTAAEGAYTLDASQTVEPCTFGAITPHGSFH